MLKDRLGKFSRHIVTPDENPDENIGLDRYQKLAASLEGEVAEFSNG